MLFRIDALRECSESWARLTEEGGKVLSSIDRNDPSKSAAALTKVMQGLRDVLEAMYAEYDHAKENSAQSGGKEHPDLETLHKWLDMYDQEYMLRESIQSVVSERGFYTQQHLNGFSALWTTEPYIDQQVVQRIMQGSSP